MQQDPENGDALVVEIHRLFTEPLPVGDEPFPWYLPPGGIADCNGLLDIPDDGEFVDAVVWQIHGSELSGRKRRRWLKRLSRTSRASVVAAMRWKSAGRQHAARVPGLGWALLFDPPVRSLLGKVPAIVLGPIRRKLVGWRYRVTLRREQATSHHSPGDAPPSVPLRPAC